MTNLLLSCKLIQGLHKKKKGNSLSQLRLLVKLKHLLIARIIYYSWCKDEQSQLKRLEQLTCTLVKSRVHSIAVSVSLLWFMHELFLCVSWWPHANACFWFGFTIQILFSVFFTLCSIFFGCLTVLSPFGLWYLRAMVPERKEEIIAVWCTSASMEEWKAGVKDRVFKLGSDGGSDLKF